MAPRKKLQIRPRKQPQQRRSTRLVEAILQAAVRVLQRHGAAGFTTIRVAQQAGVSVGSLYQYFPNKQSILLRLQEDEWRETGSMLEAIFCDRRRSPGERIRAGVRAFFRSECEEGPLRRALADAAPLFRDAPQTQAQRERGMVVMQELIDEAVPGIPARRRALAAELLMASVGGLGEYVSDGTRSTAEVDAWAAATADMLLAYLRELATSSRTGRAPERA